MEENNNFQEISQMKKKSKTPEEKREERKTLFCKNAQPRVNRIIATLDELAGIAGSERYEYTQENAEKMFGAIEEALNYCKEKYANNVRIDRKEFTF